MISSINFICQMVYLTYVLASNQSMIQQKTESVERKKAELKEVEFVHL